jgi:hypothetical protein
MYIRGYQMPKLGAYSKEIILARPDGRSKEGRLLSQMRRALIAHLGGEARLSDPQRAMVERAAMLQLRCAVLDRKILDGTFSEYDSKVYLAFSNSLTRTLARLGLYPTTTTAGMTAVDYGRLLDARRAEDDAA